MFNIDSVNAIYQTFLGTAFASGVLVGVKVLAVALALVNVLKKYNERLESQDGVSWGLQPSELLKTFVILVLVVFCDNILSSFDAFLVNIETQFTTLAPQITSLNQVQDEIETYQNWMTAIMKFTSGLFIFELATDVLGYFIWVFDLFLYAFFLVERFFLLALLQTFFPIVITLAVYDKFRPLAYNFFKLYTAVYLIVPCFFIVNIFSNELYRSLQTNFTGELFFGVPVTNAVLMVFTANSAMIFTFLVKLKLYKKSVQFMFKLFS